MKTFFSHNESLEKSFEENDDFTRNYMRQESLLLARTFGTNKEYLDTVFRERKALSPAINDYNVALFKKEKYVPVLPVLYKSILHPGKFEREDDFISVCIRNIDAMVSISPADAAEKLNLILQKFECQEIHAAVHYFMKVNMIY